VFTMSLLYRGLNGQSSTVNYCPYRAGRPKVGAEPGSV